MCDDNVIDTLERLFPSFEVLNLDFNFDASENVWNLETIHESTLANMASQEEELQDLGETSGTSVLVSSQSQRYLVPLPMPQFSSPATPSTENKSEKKGREPSVLWKWFEIKKDDQPGKKSAKDKDERRSISCKVCDKVLKTTCGTTTSLVNHLRALHPQEFANYTTLRAAQKLSQLTKKRSLSPTFFHPDAVSSPRRAMESFDEADEYYSPSSKSAKYDVFSNSKDKSKKQLKPFSRNDPHQIKIDVALTVLLSSGCLAFYEVAHWAFKFFVKTIDPRVHIKEPQAYLKTNVPALAAILNAGISSLLMNEDQGRATDIFSLTSDLWSSRNNKSYMSLTIHFINKAFEMRKFLISCSNFVGAHTAENIMLNTNKQLEGSFRRFLEHNNMNHQLIFTTDAGSNIVKACKSNPAVDFHLKCLDHAIHNMYVQAEKKNIHRFTNFKTLVQFTSQSNKFYEMLEKAAENEDNMANYCSRKIIKPCRTRWNSMRDCLESILSLKIPLYLLKNYRSTNKDEKNFLSKFVDVVPTEEDFSFAKDIMPSLTAMAEVSKIFSQDKVPVIHRVIEQLFGLSTFLEKQIAKLSDEGSKNFVSDLYSELKRRYPENGEDNICYFGGMMFNPKIRGKHSPAKKKYFDQAYKAFILNSRCHKLWLKKQQEGYAGSPPDFNENEDEDEEEEDSYLNMLRREEAQDPSFGEDGPLRQSLTRVNVKSPVQNEWEDYAAQPLYKLEKGQKDFDILAYWKTFSSQWPNLAYIARSILGIQVSSSTSERVFSKAGNTVTARRERLSAAHVEQLVLIACNCVTEERFLEIYNTGISHGSETNVMQAWNQTTLSSIPYPDGPDYDNPDEEVEDLAPQSLRHFLDEDLDEDLSDWDDADEQAQPDQVAQPPQQRTNANDMSAAIISIVDDDEDNSVSNEAGKDNAVLPKSVKPQGGQVQQTPLRRSASSIQLPPDPEDEGLTNLSSQKSFSSNSSKKD